MLQFRPEHVEGKRMWRQPIKEAWASLKALLTPHHVGKRHRIDVVKRKIRSYVEHGQRGRPSGALFNYNTLVDVVDADEQVYLQEALDELVAGGILDRVVGRFYMLKSAGPTAPMYP